MKANVLKPYTDRLEHVVRLPGDVVELTAERARELAEGGYVEAVGAAERADKPDYGSMAYADLKRAAKEAGIPATGKKADLVAALEALK